MYQTGQGELQIVVPNGRYSNQLPVGTVYLPFTADMRIIGGREEVKLLIEDLQEYLNAGTEEGDGRN